MKKHSFPNKTGCGSRKNFSSASIHSISLAGQMISYELQRKKVKNINLRIRSGGEILVSAGKNVSLAVIEDFLQRKESWILRILAELPAEKQLLPNNKAYLCGELISLPDGCDKEKWQKQMAQEILPVVYEEAWQLFCKDGFEKPVLRLRKMKSRWGSCIPAKGIITLNTALVGAERDCQLAVAAHELCHMLHPNHSAAFYSALERHFPDYRLFREKLKQTQNFLLDS